MTENKYASRDLLVRGMAAAKAGEVKEAHFFLEWYLSQNPPLHERNDALYYLFMVTSDIEVKRKLIETMLDNDPVEGRARRELAILNGELNPADIVDPDRLSPQRGVEVSTNPDRFVCPQCGGRMTFTPDGRSLTCEFCAVREQRKETVSLRGDDNFMIALATAQGHSNAVNTQVVHCKGCAAEFIVPPRQLAWQCPYCQSNYKIEQREARPVVQPHSLVPFYVSSHEAASLVQDWLEENEDATRPQLSALQGIYIPAWTFDVGGFISWVVEVYENKEWKPKKDQKALYHDDILVAASHSFPEWRETLLESFDLRQLVPFDYGYLADWTAETYRIQAGDAALQAREIALDRERDLIRQYATRPVRETHINSTRMTVEQYKLILLPVWSGLLTLGQIQLQVLINGQNGRMVSPPPPRKGLGGWLTRLLR